VSLRKCSRAESGAGTARNCSSQRRSTTAPAVVKPSMPEISDVFCENVERRLACEIGNARSKKRIRVFRVVFILMVPRNDSEFQARGFWLLGPKDRHLVAPSVRAGSGNVDDNEARRAGTDMFVAKTRAAPWALM